MTALSPLSTTSDAGQAAHGKPQPPRLLTLRDLQNLTEAGEVDTVLLALPDMQGRLKGKRHDARHFLNHIAPDGAEACAYVLATDVDMRPLDGFNLTSWRTGYHDLHLRPDLNTLRIVPWMLRTVLVHGDAFHPDGRPIHVSPRQMLRHQLGQLARLGLQAKVGIETEFVLYEGTYAQIAETGHHRLRPVTSENLDYALDHAPRLDGYLRGLADALAGAGLPVEAIKTESAPGQVEVTFPYGKPLAAADGHTVFRHATRALAQRAEMSPTFMAAPETGLASGLHVHLSLWRDDEPVLAEGGSLSELARHAVAGLLELLPDLAPLYAPTINSYKRYGPNSFAPTAYTWGRDNRTCAVRTTGHGSGLHFEVRLPGADANPYLTLAAILAAARHGIEKQLAPPPPCRGSAYDVHGAPAVPAVLEEAAAAFRRSRAAGELIGQDVVEHYAHAADIDVSTHRHTVTDTERQRGFARA